MRYESLTVGELTVNRIKLRGNLTLEDTVWDDLRFPAQSVNPPGQVSDPTWDNTNVGWTFADNATQMLQLVGEFPHSYKEGSDLKPHIHWTASAAGLPLWRLEYKWYNNGDIEPANFTTIDVVSSIFTWSTGRMGQVSDFPDIPGTGMKKSSIISFKLSRIGGDAADTYTGDALQKIFDFHFEGDSIASDNERPPYG